MHSIFRTEEDQFKKFPEAKYLGYQPDDSEDPDWMGVLKRKEVIPDVPEPRIKEEVLAEGTVPLEESNNAVDNLLNELDCFELKRNGKVQEKATLTEPDMPPSAP